MIEGHKVNVWLISREKLSAFTQSARVCVWIYAFLSAYGLTIQYKKIADSNLTVIFIKNRVVKLLLQYQIVLLIIWASSFVLFKEKTLISFYVDNYLKMVWEFLGG